MRPARPARTGGRRAATLLGLATLLIVGLAGCGHLGASAGGSTSPAGATVPAGTPAGGAGAQPADSVAASVESMLQQADSIAAKGESAAAQDG